METYHALSCIEQIALQKRVKELEEENLELRECMAIKKYISHERQKRRFAWPYSAK